MLTRDPAAGRITLMDDLDRTILNLLQEEFPLVSRPYETIGKTIGLSEEETRERVLRLKKNGYIRRIGPVLERKKLGYASALCGLGVSEERIEAVAREIGKERGITHCYERTGELNLWFTITKRTEAELEAFLLDAERSLDVQIHRFPERRTFKIKTFFPL